MQIGIAKYMMTRSQQDTSSCNSDSNVEYTNEFKEGKKVLPKPCNIVKPTASVLPVIKMESGTSVVAEGVSASEDKVCVEVTRMLSNCYETEACTVRTNGHLNAEESDSSDNGIPNEEPSKDEISVSGMHYSSCTLFCAFHISHFLPFFLFYPSLSPLFCTLHYSFIFIFHFHASLTPHFYSLLSLLILVF